MQIETFEVISIDEQGGNVVNELVSEEALALIESLGLDGQRQLVATHHAGDETVATRNPYREMTAEESAIFSAVLPRRVVIHDYADGPIPLRVLQVAAHAKTLDFNAIEVWCPQTRQEPDPLLVAWKGERWSGGRKCFILARWGEVLEPLDVLRVKARTMIASRVRSELAKAKAQLAQFEAAFEANLDRYVQTGEDTSEILSALNFAPAFF